MKRRVIIAIMLMLVIVTTGLGIYGRYYLSNNKISDKTNELNVKPQDNTVNDSANKYINEETLVVMEGERFVPYISYEDSSDIQISGDSISYEIKEDSVILTAIKPGEATVTVTSKNRIDKLKITIYSAEETINKFLNSQDKWIEVYQLDNKCYIATNYDTNRTFIYDDNFNKIEDFEGVGIYSGLKQITLNSNKYYILPTGRAGTDANSIHRVYDKNLHYILSFLYGKQFGDKFYVSEYEEENTIKTISVYDDSFKLIKSSKEYEGVYNIYGKYSVVHDTDGYVKIIDNDFNEVKKIFKDSDEYSYYDYSPDIKDDIIYIYFDYSKAPENSTGILYKFNTKTNELTSDYIDYDHM